MSISERYETLKDKVRESEYRRKDFIDKISKNIEDVIKGISSMDENTKNMIISIDPRFLNEDFLLSIKDMQYQEILNVKKDLTNMLNLILSDIEKSIE